MGICYKAPPRDKRKSPKRGGSKKITPQRPHHQREVREVMRILEQMYKKQKGNNMAHRADRCFVCKERYDEHGRGVDNKGKPCKSFEFVPASSRSDKDILFAAPFQSESSAKVYSVQSWRQGDFSCNCTGWRNHRTCKHIDEVKANPAKYKNKQSVAINATVSAGSVAGTVDLLTAEMAAMEEAVKRGNPVELAEMQAKIEYHRAMFAAADAGLKERFAQVQTNIKQQVLGEPKQVQSAPITTPVQTIKVDNIDDPFGD